ncbi:MAG: hypothetical protein EOO60_06215, partial [Hymenobacter sp.]
MSITTFNNTPQLGQAPGNPRRNFLKSGAVLGSALLAAPGLLSSSDALGATSEPRRADAAKPAALPRRTLGQGKAGFEVTALGFGCMGMSYHRGPAPDRKTMLRLLQKVAESGVTLFDTAEVY